MNNEINFIEISDLFEPIIYFEKNIKKYRYKAISKENNEIRFTVFVEINDKLFEYLEQHKIPYTSYKNWKGKYKNSYYNYYELYLPLHLSNFKKEFLEDKNEQFLHS